MRFNEAELYGVALLRAFEIENYENRDGTRAVADPSSRAILDEILNKYDIWGLEQVVEGLCSLAREGKPAPETTRIIRGGTPQEEAEGLFAAVRELAALGGMQWDMLEADLRHQASYYDPEKQ